MGDKPILFSGPMVRALLNGSKTQTRRTIKLPDWATHVAYDAFHGWRFSSLDHSEPMRLRIDEGDRLWVRESWQSGMSGDGPQLSYKATPDYFAIDAWDGPDEGAGPSFNYDRCPGADFSHWLSDVIANDGPWRPSIHMPRWASRLTLAVTDVRVERLQDCCVADAIAEGIRGNEYEGWFDYSEGDKPCDFLVDPRQSYRTLWNSINGDGAWEANPWVAAYTFTVQRGNIDQLSGQAHG